MKDNWTWVNELIQNLVCSGIAALWLYTIYEGRQMPYQLDLAFMAVLLFLGLKGYKAK